MDHNYDFYKPDPFSEYPTVDGHQSIEVYLNSLRQCYSTFKAKYFKAYHQHATYFDFSYFAFHTPFSKMVQKSYYALLLEDIKHNSGAYDTKLVETLKQTDFKID